MLVVNHLSCVLDFGDMSKKRMTLNPGNNEVNDTLWKVWSEGSLKCDGLDWHIKEKHVEAFESVDITTLEETEAVAIVEETDNLQLLRTWSEAEKKNGNRLAVLSAIGERVEALE
jgi:hypothetical protein